MDKSRIPLDQAEALGALLDDHRLMKKQFKAFKDTQDRSEKESIAQQVCHALTLHAELEEEIFYPSLRDLAADINDLLDEAGVEHEVARDLVARIRGDLHGDRLEACFTVLAEYVTHHIQEEEGELFDAVIHERVNLRDTATRMAARRKNLAPASA